MSLKFMEAVLKDISNEQPLLFQCNNLLYVATKDGFGYLQSVCVKNDMKNAHNVIERIDGDGIAVLDEQYEPFFTPFKGLYKRDEFCLANISDVVEKYGSLSREKVPQMTLRKPREWLDDEFSEAHMLDRSEVASKVSVRENVFETQLHAYLNKQRKIEKLSFTTHMLLTKHIMVCYPIPGKLYRELQMSWDEKTALEQRWCDMYGSSTFLHLEHTDIGEESPYGVCVTMNGMNVHHYDKNQIDLDISDHVEAVTEQVQVVTKHMPLLDRYIQRLNACHYMVNEYWIERRKKRV